MASLRRGWFVEFEREFAREFAATFRGQAGRQWYPAISEADWTVSAVRRPAGETVSVSLPYNYLLFRPAAVAHNVATRLREHADGREERDPASR